MPTISLCMIVKDEEKILKKQLNHIKNYVDEIIIVDTGSTDNTKKIAKKFTKNIYDFGWCDDFSKARNFSLSKATKDWILVLNAGEFFKDPKELRNVLEKGHADLLTFEVLMALVDYDNLDKNRYETLKQLAASPSHNRAKMFRQSLGVVYRYRVHEVPFPAKDKKVHKVHTKIKIFNLRDVSNENRKPEYYSILCEKAIEEGSFDANIVCNLLDYYVYTSQFLKFEELLSKTKFKLDEGSSSYLNQIIERLNEINRSKEAEKLSSLLP